MKKKLLYIFAAMFLCQCNASEAASINVADREMKALPAAETTFGDRIDAILATGGEEVSGRVKLGLLLHSDGHILIDDEIKNIIYQKLRKKFPKEEFAIMKATDVATFLLRQGDMKQRMLSDMNERDYVAAAIECNYDYLLAINFVHDERWNAPSMKADDGGEETVWMKIRLVYPKHEGYLYRNDFAVTGTSTKNHIRCRVKPKMVESYTQEFLDDLAIDYRDDNSTAYNDSNDNKINDNAIYQEKSADAVLGGSL